MASPRFAFTTVPTLLLVLALLLGGCAVTETRKAPWYLGSESDLYAQLQYWPQEEPSGDSGTQCVPESLLDPRALAYRDDSEARDVWDRVRAGFAMEGSVDERRVATQLRQLNSSQRHFDMVGTNASPYLHYVVGELESRKMPLELALLPVVESSYNPNATSRSQAAGMWQIIPDTGRRMGLEQNRWYDGRRDVVASTEAALDYLSDLHERFDGDWYLALAAYNTGEGNVERAIERNRRLGKPTDYWSLPLSQQACEYVPKLLALSRVLENPDDHGVSLARIPDKPAIAEVEVDSHVDLRRAATEAGIDGGELLRLNPALRRGMTAPTGSTTLLVPADSKDEFLAALETLPASAAGPLPQYRVRRGDTLKGIARLHETSTETLRTLNGLRNDRIVAGEYLKLPADAALPPEVFPTTASVDLDRRGIYHVKPGDNPWRIARQQKVPVETLLALNGLASDAVLKPGQRLHLRASESIASPKKPTRESAARTSSKPSDIASTKQRPATQKLAYKVRPGDSLYRIAGRYKVGVTQLMAWNGIDKRKPLIRTGQSLVLYVDTSLVTKTGAI
jgi:membrane-bound lytic murein transglycosylase D